MEEKFKGKGAFVGGGLEQNTFQLKFITLGIELKKGRILLPVARVVGHFKGGGVASRQFDYNVSVS